MQVILGETVVFDFTTGDPASGQVKDADLIPTCEIFEKYDDIPILTPTVEKRLGKIGNYKIKFDATAALGFDISNVYNIIVTATVNGITAKSRVAQFNLSSPIGRIIVSGSEYSPAESALIYAQVLDIAGAPANSATVTLNLFKSDGTKYLDSKAMTYITGSNGLYKYAFTAPTDLQRMIADVSATDPTAYGTESIYVSKLANSIDSIKKIESGRWRIINNQLIFYDENETDVLYTFDLLDSDGNPSVTSVYERRPV